MFHSLLIEGELVTIEYLILSANSWQLLSLATSQLVGDIRNSMFQAYFICLLIFGGGKLITIEDLSLSDHSYWLLPLATSQLVGD